VGASTKDDPRAGATPTYLPALRASRRYSSRLHLALLCDGRSTAALIETGEEVPKELFDILEGHPFDGDHCFLCGMELNASNRTVEHVFPRWLQVAFDLRDQTITLLNGTRIAYRNLVIPCCRQCNGEYLSQLESRVRAVVLDKTKSLRGINAQDLNAWVSKIYIGILWKELMLNFDRRNPDAGPILPPERMANFRMVHLFMQSCRKTMTFHGLETPFPNTIIATDCIADPSHGLFDYLDSTHAHAAAIRMGEKGLLCVFDGGLHDYVFPDFADTVFEQKALHPIQFKEVFAKVAYKSMLSLRIPYFGFIQDGDKGRITVVTLAFDDHNMSARALAIGTEDGPITMMPILPDSALDGPAYDDWSQEDYAHVLSMYSGVPFEELFQPPDLVVTTLRDQNGKFVDMSSGSN